MSGCHCRNSPPGRSARPRRHGDRACRRSDAQSRLSRPRARHAGDCPAVPATPGSRAGCRRRSGPDPGSRRPRRVRGRMVLEQNQRRAVPADQAAIRPADSVTEFPGPVSVTTWPGGSAGAARTARQRSAFRPMAGHPHRRASGLPWLSRCQVRQRRVGREPAERPPSHASPGRSAVYCPCRTQGPAGAGDQGWRAACCPA